MRRKALIAATLLFVAGMTGTVAAQNQENTQVQPVQRFNIPGSDTRLNSIYAVDNQGEFFGIIFTGNRAQFFGTVDSWEQLNLDNARICRHYLTEVDGLLRDRGTRSVVRCSQLQPQMADVEQPQQQQPPARAPQQTYPELFYAYDAEGRYIAMVINNRGEIASSFGNVDDLVELDPDSLMACEYFTNLNFLENPEEPSELECYGYQELRQKVEQGEIEYLRLPGTAG